MAMISVHLLSLITLVACHTQDQSLYVRLGSVFESICLGQVEKTDTGSRPAMPGKIGPVGAKGEPGLKGDKGDPGETDYGQVEGLISRRIGNDSLARNYYNLSSLLSEANRKIEQLENETKILRIQVENKKGYCPLQYDGKCFWLEVRYSSLMQFDEGRNICESQGGTPANIYSEDHFYMMTGYLATFARKAGYMQAWTGMTYNAQGNTVSLTDGRKPSWTLKWHPGYPTGCCHLILEAHANWKENDEFFFIQQSTDKRMGVVCEK